MYVRIYRQGRHVTQSGRAHSDEWIIEPDVNIGCKPEPLMGWTGADSTIGQIRLEFPSHEAAINFAKSKGWS